MIPSNLYGTNYLKIKGMYGIFITLDREMNSRGEGE